MEESDPTVVSDPATDPAAAEELPEHNLDRAQAAEVVTSVFGWVLEEGSGIFDHFEPIAFHSDYAAVVAPDSPILEGAGEGRHGLLASTLPLRVEAGNGEKESVNLELQSSPTGLVPQNPLIEVQAPANLADGIQLPEIGVDIRLAGAEDRAPSNLEGTSAFYPNVGEDLDLTVNPIPTGVETSTVLRSSAAPLDQRYRLTLPQGAILERTGRGGAEVMQDGEELLSIPPPTAMDAQGEAVPVSMAVSANEIELHLSPGARAQYPILLDPVFESYSWFTSGSQGIYTDWRPASNNESAFKPSWIAVWNQTMHTGLALQSYLAPAAAGNQANWNYYVPRYFTDYENPNVHERPTAFIRHMTLSQVYFLIEETSPHQYPNVWAGIWDANKGAFVSVGNHYSTEGQWSGVTIELPNEGEYTDAKNGGIALGTIEGTSYPRQVLVGSAAVELTDKDSPGIGSLSSPSGWMNESPKAINYTVSDPGLGIYSLKIKSPGRNGGSVQGTTLNQCAGTASNPCPRSATQSTRTLEYDPKSMAQGEDWAQMTATDPVGHVSAVAETRIKVDHTAPSLAVSGNLTEQASVGTKLSTYTLNYNSSDGDSTAATPATAIGAAGTGSGQLQRPIGTAVESNGNVFVVDRENNRVEKFGPNGNFISQFGSLGTGDGQFSDPRGIAVSSAGNVWVADLGNMRLEEFTSSGAFIRKITYSGFQQPFALASGPEETLWVTDLVSHRLYRFREDGTLLTTVDKAKSGSQSGSLTTPAGVTVDSNGNVWVTEQASSKVYEFSPTGASLFSFGSYGSEEGQFKEPFGIASAKSGNILVADALNNRIEVFKPDGTFLRSFGSVGAGSGQLTEPRGLAVGPGNTVYVADAGNHRVAKWSHADEDPQSGVAKVVVKLDGQIAKEETPGCATKNCAISGSWALDANNYTPGTHEVSVTATDGVGLSTTEKLNVTFNPAPPSLNLSGTITEQASLGTTRPRYVLEAEASPNSSSGETWTPAFIAAFGATGSGTGQLNGPRGVASDGKGHVWVVDRANNRVEEFNESGEYLGQFGSAGSGNGQFSSPWGIAVTPQGNIWVTDTGNKRVQEFNAKGEFIQKFGAKAAGESKGTELLEPEGIAVASNGMLWVADCAGNRVAEFRENVSSESERFVRNATGTSFKLPVGVAVDASGNVWVSEEASNHLLEFGPEGAYVRTVGSTGSGNGQLNVPAGVGVGPSGNVYVVDLGNNRVDVFNPKGEYLTKFGTAGTGNAQMNEPRAIAFGAGGAIFVSDKGNNRIHKWGAPWEGPPSFVSAFGSIGAGEGQLNGPRGVASDGKGHVWVVDRANNRVEEFDETGKYLGQFGSGGTGNGQFSSPWGIAVTPAGNIWVADTGNERLQEFNPKGEFIQKFGVKAPAGSQGTELLEPEGIAVIANGMLWVSDCRGNRVAEFRETVSLESERFVRDASGTAISSPVGVAVDGSGDVWVAEETANHLLEFDAEGNFVRSTGNTGTGNGQLSTPEGVGVGPSGNVYAVDLGNNRVDVFNRNGQFLTKFGTAGTGNGNFSEPRAIAFGASGAIFVSDKGNNRVHKWSQPVPSDQVSGIEVKVDGKPVGTTVLGCASSSCSLGRQWILSSPEYLGGHMVTVKATTVAGWTATRSVAVEENRDETAPTLESGGALINAPEGWVQQEGYGFTATATDSGYGITSLKLKVDGSVVASEDAKCTEGACPLSLSGSLNMTPFKGGEHQGELLATDGAGNVKKKTWIIRIDPSGTVSPAESEDTLEAVEATSEINLLRPTEGEEELEGTTAGLDFEEGEFEYIVSGSLAPTTVSTDPAQGITVSVPPQSALATNCSSVTEQPESSLTGEEEEALTNNPLGECPEATGQPEETVQVAPLVTSAEADEAVLSEGQAAAVSANYGSQTDMVTKPLFDGAMSFAAIRDPSGPTHFSWRIDLDPEENLELVDSHHALVYYEGGHPAFTISAVAAHDAIGTAVPTSLSVEGDVVTLNVDHRQFDSGGKPVFTYPVIGGVGWEGGFQTVEVELPPGEMPGEEEVGAVESSEEEAGTVRTVGYGPPQPASSSNVPLAYRNPENVPVRKREYQARECTWHYEGTEVTNTGGGRNYSLNTGICTGRLNEGDYVVSWAYSVQGVYKYKKERWAWTEAAPDCNHWGPAQPATIRCRITSNLPQYPTAHALGMFRFGTGKYLGGGTPECVIAEAVLPDYYWHDLSAEPVMIRNFHLYRAPVGPNDPCPWGELNQIH